MMLKAHLTWDRDGSLVNAHNLIVDDTLRFATLLEAWTVLYPGWTALYTRIERELERQARVAREDEVAERVDHQRWAARQ